VDLRLLSPEEILIPLSREGSGYWSLTIEDARPGSLYTYILDGRIERPDPASHSQPRGVHGPSQIVHHGDFAWQDGDWPGMELSRMVIYEIHTGTFTPEGSFDAVIPRLEALQEMGINTLEIMPVAQFPGDRNWGYDGVYPFAVQDSYGGARSFKHLVNTCHRQGMAVILDVVYNHLGPEGNYLRDYGPYFTDKYKTPWGQAINFDDAYSDEVRNFFIQNALYWFWVYHVDGLRLDAVHGIVDMSARPFLQELAEAAGDYSRRTGRAHILIAESDLNDAGLIAPPEAGGYGLDAQWCDDFHHSVHTLLTGENDGYYADFGRVSHLVQSIREGFVYTGAYSTFRNRRHGNSSRGRPAEQFIVFSQNHDQVGNRMLGERLSRLVDFESLKLSIAVVLLSPFIPLLFMGEEYGEKAPFLYFVSHSDPDLVEAVRNGRKKEFASFRWKGAVPDPDDLGTFLGSRIQWELRDQGAHRVLREFTKTLIALRRTTPAFSNPSKDHVKVEGWEESKVIVMRRWEDRTRSQSLCIFNFNRQDISFPMDEFPSEGTWTKHLESSDRMWLGGKDCVPGELLPRRHIELMRRSMAVYLRGELQS
jgi:maltooligosyltrehalose trehalohydrolase